MTQGCLEKLIISCSSIEKLIPLIEGLSFNNLTAASSIGNCHSWHRSYNDLPFRYCIDLSKVDTTDRLFCSSVRLAKKSLIFFRSSGLSKRCNILASPPANAHFGTKLFFNPVMEATKGY